MNRVNIVQSYVEHLSNGALENVLSLFAKDAIVRSPLYGNKNYKDFYTELFADTNNSEISVKGIFEDPRSGNLALHFIYQWTLSNEKQVHFEVVDIIEFTSDDKISTLTIIYDTVLSRELLKELK